MLTESNKYKQSGRHTYKTSVSKFLLGGRYTDALKGHNKIVNGMDDPSHLAFVFGIVPEPSGLFATKESDSYNYYDFETDRQYGALNYLESCVKGDSSMDSGLSDEDINSTSKAFTDKYNKVEAKNMLFPIEYENLYSFVYGFWEICKGHQYTFQTVEGLQDAYKKYYTNKKDSFLGATDNKIKITCLESMDLRMTALFDAYYNAVYNHRYRRMNIPHNLIRFNCYIMLHDLRNIVPPGFTMEEKMKAAATSDVVANMSTVLFVFKDCTIDIDECGQSFSTMTNTEATETKFDFTFNYADLQISVESLADFLEYDWENAHRAYYDTLDISALNGVDRGEGDAEYDRYIVGQTGDMSYSKNEIFGNAYDDDFTLNIGGFLKKAGAMVYNYLTNGTQMGNVYDESWAGMIANMVSSISNGGIHALASPWITRGKEYVMEKIDDYAQERFGNKGTETKVIGNADLNLRARGDNPNAPSVSTLGGLELNQADGGTPTKMLGGVELNGGIASAPTKSLGGLETNQGGNQAPTKNLGGLELNKKENQAPTKSLGALEQNPRNAPSGPAKTLGKL